MLDPFFVLDIPVDASDELVEARYQALVRQFPPDRAPDRFRVIRAAYGAVRTQRDRVQADLFGFDATGQALTRDLPAWLDGLRRRLDRQALVAFLNGEAP